VVAAPHQRHARELLSALINCNQLHRVLITQDNWYTQTVTPLGLCFVAF
jgi:hypothetical protein